MPGYLIQAGATLQCPHGGEVEIISSNSRVQSESGPLATSTDQFLVAGCKLTAPGTKPCVQVQWLQPATRVFIGKVPAVVSPSVSLTDGVPPGPALVLLTQTRVWGI